MKQFSSLDGVVVPIRNRPDLVDNTNENQKSPGDFSGEHSGISRSHLLAQFRDQTPVRWMSFLHAHFGSALEVTLFFEVDEKTGRNWWRGVGRPTVDKVLYAEHAFPAGYQTYMIAAE